MPSTALLHVACLLLAAVSSADYLIWDYDMQSCPPGWFEGLTWWFYYDGAHSTVAASYADPYAFDQLHSGTNVAPVLFGCDSILIDIDKHLVMVSNWLGSVEAGVCYRINGGSWIGIWDAPGGSDVYYDDSSPIHVSIPLSTPCTLGLRFWSSAVRYHTMEGNAWVTWNVSHLTVTACGFFLGMEQDTWGGIKALVGAE
jgi:hypothetical protein